MSTLAHIEDRWEKVMDGQRVRTPRYGNGSRWRARYLDPRGQQRSQCFARRVDAERFLANVETTKLHGTYVDPDAGRITLNRFFEDWAGRQLWESNTDRAMRLALSCSDLGQLLREIRRTHVEGWIKRMHTRGLAPGTIKTRFTNVRSVFRAAVREHLIVQNPTDDVALPRVRRRAASMTLPTAAQVASVINHAEPWFQAFIAVAAFAGLRLGEAAALKTGDIDHEALTLDVRRQVQRAGEGKVEIRAPKYGSERTVYLAAGLVELLDDHVRDHCPVGQTDCWLFAGGADDPPHQNTVGHQWRRACRRAGVEGVTLHDLRRFFASGLIAAGCDVVTVQRALGHAKATTTLNTYAHLWPTAEDRTRQAAADLMAGQLVRPAPRL